MPSGFWMTATTRPTPLRMLYQLPSSIRRSMTMKRSPPSAITAVTTAPDTAVMPARKTVVKTLSPSSALYDANVTRGW